MATFEKSQPDRPLAKFVEMCEASRKGNGAHLGDFGERLWSAVFKSAKIPYTSLAKIFEGGAPKQHGTGLILPDFDLSTNRISVYADSKAKARYVVFEKAGNEKRHGIDRRNYLHYLDISEHDRKHCLLCIFECFEDADFKRWSGVLLAQSLFRLGQPLPGMRGTAGEGMVYWPRSKFQELESMLPHEALAVVRGDGVPSASIRAKLLDLLHVIEDDPKQKLLFS